MLSQQETRLRAFFADSAAISTVNVVGAYRTARLFINGACTHHAPQRGKLRPPFQIEETFLAKPNYSFEKRQREIARKKKQDEKRQRKVQRAPDEPAPVDQQTQPTPPETGTAT